MFFFFFFSSEVNEDDRPHSGQRANFSTAVCFVHIYPVTKCGNTGLQRVWKVLSREFILREPTRLILINFTVVSIILLLGRLG